MRTALFCSLVFIFSMPVIAQSHWGESFAPDHKVEVVNAENMQDPFTTFREIADDARDYIADALWFKSGVEANNSYSYGMLGVDGDLLKAAQDKLKNIKVWATGDLPPRGADPANAVSFPGVPVVDPTDVWGSLVVYFVYSSDRLIGVIPGNNTPYPIEFSNQGSTLYKGEKCYEFIWTYKGSKEQHHMYAAIPNR
ncbi:MAG: hypothetical protein NTY22_05645 [Proteobacteria bacterium]|nr:hypothetical protein [Pseudomonadota bacterium]